jgi:hypothetical protein
MNRLTTFTVIFALSALSLTAYANQPSAPEGATTQLAQYDDNREQFTPFRQEFDAENTHFPGARWGMTMQQVRELEDAEYVGTLEDGSKTTLWYGGSLLGRDILVRYAFNDNQLYEGTYMLRYDHDDPQKYFEDYAVFQEELASELGPPTSDTVRWTDNTFRDDPSRHGIALEREHLFIFSAWELPETEVVLSLGGATSGPNLGINYTSLTVPGPE